MSGPPDDALAQARSRLDAIRARRSELRAEIDELKAGSAGRAGKKQARRRLREMEAQDERLGEEMEAAHTALGRAILDQFERDFSKLRIPTGDPEAARELTTMAESLRHACLTVLADWPELLDEARRRLVLRPPGPTTLHG